MGLRARVSGAHLLMLIAGTLAFALVLVVLRDRSALVTVAVAGTDLEPGVALGQEAVDVVELPAAVGELGGLIDPGLFAADSTWRVAAHVPGGALLRSSDIVPGSPDRRRLMSFAVESSQAVGGAVEPGDLIDVVTVRDGEAAFAVTGVAVASVEAGPGVGRGGVTLTVVVAPGQELHIAEALASGDLHIVRALGG